MNDVSNTVTYGSTTFDLATLPPASILALVSRGITHRLGNEVSSAVIARIKKHNGAVGEDGKVKVADWGKEEIKAWKAANPDLLAEWTNAEVAEAIDEILKGEMGMRQAGQRLDPLATEIDRLAKAKVDSIIGAKVSKLPKGWKKVEDGPTITFGADTVTYMDLVARAKVKFADAFDRQARKTLDAKAREAVKAKEALAGATSLEDLGL